jgi:phosphatidylglycerophosphatase A
MLIFLNCLSKISVFCLLFSLTYFVFKVILKPFKVSNVVLFKKVYLDDLVSSVLSVIFMASCVTIHSIYF